MENHSEKILKNLNGQLAPLETAKMKMKPVDDGMFIQGKLFLVWASVNFDSYMTPRGIAVRDKVRLFMNDV